MEVDSSTTAPSRSWSAREARFDAALAFGRERFRLETFRLAVATFNRRAIRVYERAGFAPVREYDHATNGGIHRFLEMARSA